VIAALANVHPVHDGVTYGRATLDGHPAHNITCGPARVDLPDSEGPGMPGAPHFVATKTVSATVVEWCPGSGP
jgi:hypothetical protein